ncbi:hypothetical protein Vretimale_2940 [Volvox reticuliferus]|uniref:Uncharacterized protein n=1 Tax=Volvox reticuliferus TaxID=1737510 RepID=A0A8J4D7J8_9CHLO|nr:hypothetical protein Vretifemale_6953 [Volvox reticuliferus]GIL97194.1 hypothetical protein Vretimale_2940 [Volvox reticuliferus]
MFPSVPPACLACLRRTITAPSSHPDLHPRRRAAGRLPSLPRWWCWPIYQARGALAVAGPPPPPVTEWSFREARYVQYLADQLEVHEALEAALREAAASATTTTCTSTGDMGGGSSSSTRRGDAAAMVAAAASPPDHDSLQALLQLVPGRLGLERSAAIRRDLAALRATAGHPAAVAAAAAAGRCAGGIEAVPEPEVGVGFGADPDAAAGEAPTVASIRGGRLGASANTPVVVSSPLSASEYERTAGPMARSYAQFLRRLGRVAAAGDVEQERQPGSLRLLAHAAVLHMVAQAVWVRLGATATERLALLQRGAAATYHEYPGEVIDPRVSLSRALDAAGERLRSPAARQVVFDEVPSAMQKTGLLLSALAHRD